MLVQRAARVAHLTQHARLMQTKVVRPWASHKLTNSAPSSGSLEASRLTSAPAMAPVTTPSTSHTATNNASKSTQPTQARARRPLKPRKAAITLTAKAVEHLRALLDGPQPRLIRIGVRNRGCSGLTYNLDYVEKPGKFDEEVTQDGVKVLIDSKALFSVIGSEMDWVDDKLASRFVFNNPNSKGECGCGESFMV